MTHANSDPSSIRPRFNWLHSGAFPKPSSSGPGRSGGKAAADGGGVSLCHPSRGQARESGLDKGKKEVESANQIVQLAAFHLMGTKFSWKAG